MAAHTRNFAQNYGIINLSLVYVVMYTVYFKQCPPKFFTNFDDSGGFSDHPGDFGNYGDFGDA